MKPFLFVSLLFSIFFAASFVPNFCVEIYTPPDNYLLACGSSTNVSFKGSNYLPDFNVSSSGYAVTSNATSVKPPYSSARVFSSKGSYQFKIHQAGRHWIRLYFHAIPEANLSSAAINVITDEFVLISNFSFADSNVSYLFKEYSVNITSDSFTLHFVPSPNSLTFINAIELVSIPDRIFPDQVTLSPDFSTGNLALETVYRLNMGGPLITPQNDTLGRIWENDQKYLYLNSSAVDTSIDPALVKYPSSLEPSIAPNWVYATAAAMNTVNLMNPNFNISWVLPIDRKFQYLVRIHLCDIISKSLNSLIFNIYIDDAAGFKTFDLTVYTGGLEVPYYRDFLTNVSSKEVLVVSVGPDMNSEVTNATMNGLEVLKVSNEEGSLDGIVSVSHFLAKHSVRERKRKLVFEIIMSTIVAVCVSCGIMAACVCCFSHKKRKKDGFPAQANLKAVSNVSPSSGATSFVSLSSSHNGRIFTFHEILEATSKFDERYLLGVGGFGRVYKGTLADGTKVAVKRGNSRSEQGVSEFRTEIEMLSKVRHRHLVSLIGYCDERSEMILVYEYMANGPLRSHLYGSGLPALTWKSRLEICIGAAKGLHYLHTGASQSVIHRDVKTTNILLDEHLVAKVADFGLSKAGPDLDKSHVSTAVKGSFGYLDPEYFRRQQLTEKSDVYSFGVVMMEVVCTRPALNPVLPREQVNIAEWAMSWQKKGKLEKIMDGNLVGKVNAASLRKYGETAEKCLAEHGAERPTMGDVLWNLEYALQLEETSSALMHDQENSTNHIAGIPLPPMHNSVTAVDGELLLTDDDADDAAHSAVFSHLLHPLGR